MTMKKKEYKHSLKLVLQLNQLDMTSVERGKTIEGLATAYLFLLNGPDGRAGNQTIKAFNGLCTRT